MKFLFKLLMLSVFLTVSILGLLVLDKALFYREKISQDEQSFYNEGLRITNPEIIRSANFPHLGVILGGSLFRYWFLPLDGNLQLVNYGGLEEKIEDTYGKLKIVITDMHPEFVVINGGFCQIHTAVYSERDVKKAIDSNMYFLRLMINETKSNGVVPVLSSLTPVRPVYKLPYSGMMEIPSRKKTIGNDVIRTFNSKIEQLAQTENILFVDFHKVLVDETGQLHKDYALTDGEHLNRDGYQVLNEYLVSQLAALQARQVN